MFFLLQLDIIYSAGHDLSPLDIALQHENMAAIGLLCKELFAKPTNNKPIHRVALPTSLLRNESVGQ